jgi:hypothetical protein
MGTTGYSTGPHLHFSLYRDDGDGVWEGSSRDRPVDPYGWDWELKGVDPWVRVDGEPSHYLWIHELVPRRELLGTEGGVMTDTADAVEVTFPPDAFSGWATFEVSLDAVVGPLDPLLRSIHSFLVLVREWTQSDNSTEGNLSMQASTELRLTKPVTLTVMYTNTDVLHVDESRLTLRRWDETAAAWEGLSTTVDLESRTVTAQTDKLGNFDLQAPLLCAGDSLELDDSHLRSHQVWPDDPPVARGFDVAQDRDWVKFNADQGVTYTIRTLNLAGGADTVVNLYDVDAFSLLAGNDDAGGGPSSQLVWAAPYTGTFFVETLSAPGATTGCSTTYELRITTYEAPQADFSVSRTSGFAPLPIRFTDTSTGDYDESLWHFGDGITSTYTSPTHTYTDVGAYTVTLTISGMGGTSSETKPGYITVRGYRIYLPLTVRNK